MHVFTLWEVSPVAYLKIAFEIITITWMTENIHKYIYSGHFPYSQCLELAHLPRNPTPHLQKTTT